MQIERTGPFRRDFKKLPEHVRDRARKALTLLSENPRHPSLHAKKMKGLENTWEARVTDTYRITFHVEGNTVILRRIGTHDILREMTR